MRTALTLSALLLTAACLAPAVPSTGTLPSGRDYTVTRTETPGRTQTRAVTDGVVALPYVGTPREITITVESTDGAPFTFDDTRAIEDRFIRCADGDIDSGPAEAQIFHMGPTHVLQFECIEVVRGL